MSQATFGSMAQNPYMAGHMFSNSQQAKRGRKRKKTKDPQAPRKPHTSYMYFTKENRALLRRSNPETTFAQVSEMLSRKWNSLTEEELQRYKDMAEEDKKRYLEERSAYREAKALRREPALDGPPKKAQTSYMYFTAALRGKLQKEHPDLNFAEISRMIGSKWAAISSEDRAKYQEMADKDKERFAREKEVYEAKKDTLPVEEEESQAAPKKARTSYMYFTTINRSRVQKEHPNASFAEVSKLLSKEWQGLSEGEMQKYKQLGDADKIRYQREKSMWDEAVEMQQAMPQAARPPRKAQTSYMYFTTMNRGRVQKENAGMSFSEISRILSQEWHDMSATEKQKYLQLAEQDKQRFYREKQAYEAQQAVKAGHAPPETDYITSTMEGNAPKKAQTSYMYYTTINRSRVQKQNTGASFADVSKLLSKEWGELGKAEKDKYASLAKADKQRYAQEKLAYNQVQAQQSQLVAAAAAAVVPTQGSDKYTPTTSMGGERLRYGGQLSLSFQDQSSFEHEEDGEGERQRRRRQQQQQQQQQQPFGRPSTLMPNFGGGQGPQQFKPPHPPQFAQPSMMHAQSQMYAHAGAFHPQFGNAGMPQQQQATYLPHQQNSGMLPQQQQQQQQQQIMQGPSSYLSFTRMVW